MPVTCCHYYRSGEASDQTDPAYLPHCNPESFVHLLYNRGDAQLNETALAGATPDRDVLVQVYRYLTARQRNAGDVSFSAGTSEVAYGIDPNNPMSADSVECAIAVFRELGLIQTHAEFTSGEETRTVRVENGHQKVDLTDSVRYREGMGERAIFDEYNHRAMDEDACTLQGRISAPIVPACAETGDCLCS